MRTMCYSIFFERDLAAVLTILTQTLQINCKAIAMKNRIKGRAWCSQEPQRALRWGLLEVISSPHCAAFPRPSDYTPCFCVSRLAGGESSVCSRFCSLHYHADNIRLFSRKAWDPCSFPRLSSVHEKRRNNEEPVRRRLAKPWADGDVSGSAAVSGCSQTGHALSRHGAATAGQPPHTSQSLPGSIQPPTKCQPSMK